MNYTAERRYEEIENKIIAKIKQNIIKNQTILQNPDCIFFVSWTSTNSEGRITRVWKRNGSEDEEKERILKIWSFIFPEIREDYLVEKIWKWMNEKKKRNKTRHNLLIHFCSGCDRKSAENELHVNIDFLERLNGNELKAGIEKKYEEIYRHGFDKNILYLKAARILKYDSGFNRKQINGIDKGFSWWVKQAKGHEEKADSLSNFFRLLNGVADPSRYPNKARSYLTMWQNFSIIFPDYKYVDLSFYIPNIKRNPRCAIALFYRKEMYEQKVLIKREMEELFKEVSKKLFEKKSNEPKSTKEESRWRLMKNKENELWKSVMGADIKDSLDNLLELSGRLAHSAHEGRPNKYTFIAGTEQIWPSVEETISLKFYDNQDPFDDKLFEDLCEANYSLFQIYGVAGVYNTKLQSLSKIVRLRNPTKEEFRGLRDPINDLDDFYCWTIKKIFETNSYQDGYIIHTQGNGRILIYGLTRSNNISKRESDLLLIWDVRNGKLYKPISDGPLKQIKRAFRNIDVKDPIQIKKIVTTIRKISAIPGEGTCLIISKTEEKLRNYLTKMELLNPTWLKAISLDDPQYILKASFIMDGACLITRSNIATRQAGYPHYKGKPWGIESIVKDNVLANKKDVISKRLTGRGSKTHLSANISTHPKINIDPKNPQVVVISISADGPIKIWPQELIKKK
ncbi:MAG: hypothetical protein HQ555_10390 [Candidatus Aminicenantes bacterium]|nr:hypothetical protein [Candidatus Aminicenantes bacterium]